MVDFHSHILPGIDDGAKDVNMSVEMLLLSKKQGVNTIVATPHFYIMKTTIEEFLEARQKSYDELMAYVKEHNIDIPKIVLGAEVAFCEELMDADLKKLCIEGTDALLLELPFTYLNEWVYNGIYSMSMKHGVDIILAHVERYVKNFKDFSSIKPFFDLDVYMQVNSDTFLDRKSKKIIKELMKNGKINFIGSDSHNLSKRASSMDLAANKIIKKYGEDKLKKIMYNGKKFLDK